ncbi:MAG: UDP-3-O-(3-hydroxymyristoyl)glucosamine N-acyltransferase [Xanthomonadales bacterium]|nr:UDP-3-O-(3-hydroxymyristoyl)glucosamine N-acyltransferase [Xanthomonadales bacterium]
MAVAMRNYSLSDLSARFELDLRGNGAHVIEGVGTLSGAAPSQITFLANRAYRTALPGTTAGAVIVSKDDVKDCPTNALIAKDPYLAFARVAALFDPRPAAEPGVHSSAVVHDSATLGHDVSVGPNAVIGAGCTLGDGCTVGPGTVIEANSALGEGCRLYANVSLGYGVTLGKRVMVHPGAVIGADGFGIAFAGDHWEKVPQLGSVEIGDDCEIGANTCIDRGAVENTVLEEDVRLDNLVQIAHNVRVGAHSAFAGGSGVAGSGRVGRYCMIGGHAGVNGHIDVADRTTVAANSTVYRTITEPGTTWSAQMPARPIRQWQKNYARLQKLDDLARTVKRLEKTLGKSDDNE